MGHPKKISLQTVHFIHFQTLRQNTNKLFNSSILKPWGKTPTNCSFHPFWNLEANPNNHMYRASICHLQKEPSTSSAHWKTWRWQRFRRLRCLNVKFLWKTSIPNGTKPTSLCLKETDTRWSSRGVSTAFLFTTPQPMMKQSIASLLGARNLRLSCLWKVRRTTDSDMG